MEIYRINGDRVIGPSDKGDIRKVNLSSPIKLGIPYSIGVTRDDEEIVAAALVIIRLARG